MRLSCRALRGFYFKKFTSSDCGEFAHRELSFSITCLPCYFAQGTEILIAKQFFGAESLKGCHDPSIALALGLTRTVEARHTKTTAIEIYTQKLSEITCFVPCCRDALLGKRSDAWIILAPHRESRDWTWAIACVRTASLNIRIPKDKRARPCLSERASPGVQSRSFLGTFYMPPAERSQGN